jgi:uncharacterized protein YjbI with pentapeptide repeats
MTVLSHLIWCWAKATETMADPQRLKLLFQNVVDWNLVGADLHGANLHGAILQGANLSGALLS